MLRRHVILSRCLTTWTARPLLPSVHPVYKPKKAITDGTTQIRSIFTLLSRVFGQRAVPERRKTRKALPKTSKRKSTANPLKRKVKAPPSTLETQQTVLDPKKTASTVTTAKRTLTIPPRMIPAKKAEYHDHKSYLQWATKQGIKPESSQYKGTSFEYETIGTFQSYGAKLERVGATNDRGIDAQGQWPLPDGQVLDIIIQCKNTKCFSRHVRELRGTPRDSRTLGILATSQRITPGMDDALLHGQAPMMLIQIEKGKIVYARWNDPATQAGLGRLSVVPKLGGKKTKDKLGEVLLFWEGKQWATTRTNSLKDSI